MIKAEDVKKIEKYLNNKKEQKIRNEQNIKFLQESSKAMEEKRKEVIDLKDKLAYVNHMLALVTKFNAEKKKAGSDYIRLAFNTVCQIVPQFKSLKLNIKKDGRAGIYKESFDPMTGREINTPLRLEQGSGFNSIISMAIRCALLKNSPEYLQNAFFDEPLAKVDDTNSAAIGLYRKPIFQDLNILLVEQKNSVFSNMGNFKRYTFSKETGSPEPTEVKVEVVQ